MFNSVRQRRKPEDASARVNVAPLIDLSFILLIFFVVTATFVQETGIRVDRPRAVHSAPVDGRSMRVSISAGGAIYHRGEPVALNQLKGRLRTHVLDTPGAALIIIPDARTRADKLVAVMDTAKLAGIESIAVATRAKDIGVNNHRN